MKPANQHQDCDALTKQIMGLQKSKEKVQSHETNQQVKFHSINEIND
jgi:site-specific DNA recombinase